MIIKYLNPWGETKRATEAGWTQKAFLNNVGPLHRGIWENIGVNGG